MAVCSESRSSSKLNCRSKASRSVIDNEMQRDIVPAVEIVDDRAVAVRHHAGYVAEATRLQGNAAESSSDRTFVDY